MPGKPRTRRETFGPWQNVVCAVVRMREVHESWSATAGAWALWISVHRPSTWHVSQFLLESRTFRQNGNETIASQFDRRQGELMTMLVAIEISEYPSHGTPLLILEADPLGRVRDKAETTTEARWVFCFPTLCPRWSLASFTYTHANTTFAIFPSYLYDLKQKRVIQAMVSKYLFILMIFRQSIISPWILRI